MPFARSNPHRFTTTNANKATIDDELNIQTGWINVLDQRIDDVESKGIAGATDIANVGKLPTTDGENINWIKLTLDYFQLRSLTGEVFQNASIPQRVLGNVCVGTPQLIDLSVTHPKIALTSVYNINIADNTIQLPKLRSSGHSCFVIGDDANYAYKELLVAANYTIPTRIANETLPSMQPISVVWNNSADNVCFGTKLKDASILMSKLRSSTKKCLVMGTEGSHFYTEKVADNETQAWYVFCNNPNSASIALNSLVDIWQNTPFTFAASKLTNATVTLNKLAQEVLTTIKNNAFATATVSAKGGLLRNTNVASVTKLGTGQYRVTFSSQPASGSTNYNVQLSIGGTYSCSWANKTLNSVDVNIYTTSQYYDAPFDVVISDAYA